MSFQNFDEVFEAFNSLKVLVIGDVMIDSYLWGKVDRISPEAPVPVVNLKNTEKRLGGAANVAVNVKSLGATPILCTVIGQDEDGRALVDLLEKQGYPTEGLVFSAKRKTTVKHRIIAGSQQLLRLDSEDDHELLEEDNVSLIKKAKLLLSKVDVLIFEDYDKGVLSADNIEKIVAEAKKLNVPVVVDPKKRNFLAYKNVDLFKPNLKELKEGLNIHCDPTRFDDLRQAVNKLALKLNQKYALITLSEHGAYLASEETEVYVSAHKRNISDVSGAGDTVISVASLCLALKLSMEQLVNLSNLAGGLVCEYIGVVPIDKTQLLTEAKVKIKF